MQYVSGFLLKFVSFITSFFRLLILFCNFVSLNINLKR